MEIERPIPSKIQPIQFSGRFREIKNPTAGKARSDTSGNADDNPPLAQAVPDTALPRFSHPKIAEVTMPAMTAAAADHAIVDASLRGAPRALTQPSSQGSDRLLKGAARPISRVEAPLSMEDSFPGARGGDDGIEKVPPIWRPGWSSQPPSCPLRSTTTRPASRQRTTPQEQILCLLAVGNDCGNVPRTRRDQSIEGAHV
jgi:hypothetical protein